MYCMIEIISRPTGEIDRKDELDLQRFLARGLMLVSTGQLLYAGFSSRFVVEDQYVPPKNDTFAVSTAEWRESMEWSTGLGNPIMFAWDSVGDRAAESPAVGVFDGGLLEPEPNFTGTYVPKPGLLLADTCLRIVIWDK